MHQTRGGPPPDFRFWQSLGAGLLLLACVYVGLARNGAARQAAIQGRGAWPYCRKPRLAGERRAGGRTKGGASDRSGGTGRGLRGSPGILATHPEGHLVAWSRHPVLCCVYHPPPMRAPAHPHARLACGCSAMGQRHPLHIRAPMARVAIATGGSHDPQGPVRPARNLHQRA